MQSHVVDRHHFSRNLIQSWGLIFLVKSSKPKPLISRKKYSASGKRCFTLSKKAQETNQPTPRPKQTKNQSRKPKPVHAKPHTTDFSHWNCFSLIIMKASPSWRYSIVFYFLKHRMTEAVWWCLWKGLQAHRLFWLIWNVLEAQMIWVILPKLVRLLNLKTVQ